jgi:CRISPR-associated protein Cas2
VIYDINTIDQGGQSRLVKVMKTCRKYLTHVQRSVFEGNITEGQLINAKLKVNQGIEKR